MANNGTNGDGAHAAVATHGIQILLVEDTPSHARIVQKMLTDSPLGYELSHAVQLRDAVTHLAKSHVDVVLLDLTLPDSDGMDTIDGVRNAAPRVPVVVLTSLENLGEESLRHGAQDFLVKGKANGPDVVRSITFAINRQRLYNQSLEQLALVDSLTGALNRRGLEQVLAGEGTRVRRSGASTVAVLVDLDDFKNINDTLGHAVGDMVLREVAERMKAGLRGNDQIARIGGDEFAAVLPETRLMEGLAVAERIRLSLSSLELTIGDKHVRVTASLGVAKLTKDSAFVIDELVALTDAALARSKRRGKNRVSYAQDLEEGPPEDTEVFDAAMEMLRRGDGMRVVKQPILRLEDRLVTGYEMLSRGPEGFFENPADFFRIAYEGGLMTIVDRRCLQNCVAAAGLLDSAGRYHVNLLPSTIVGVPAEELADIFAVAGRGRKFCVEISEQQTLGDPSYLLGPIKKLREAGLQFAMDDVGSGGCCLESLLILEPEIVKIDGKCVRGARKSPEKLRAMERLMRICEVLKAEAVAEGIESEEDLEVLKSLGVKFGQGFLLGRPA